MQNLWQKKLRLNYSKDVFDIVQFGSSLFEGSKPNDLDIAVIFLKLPVKEQLNQAQEIKRQIEKFSELPVHIFSFDLYSFFEESNFAKNKILFYGKSLISGNFFAKKFGFTPKIQISYSLDKLNKKDKVRFHYMLKGRNGKYGMLKEYGGELLNPGLIEIDSLHETLFIESMKKISNEINVRKILV